MNEAATARGENRFSADDFLQQELETMPREELSRMQEDKVRGLVRWAYERSPFYRERWDQLGVHPSEIGSITDFQKRIPLLNKADLVGFRDRTGDPYCGLLCVSPALVNNIGTTSGTTSEPMPLIELASGAPPFASTVRDMWGAGLRPGDRVIHTMATQRGPQERVYQRIGCVPLMVNVRPGADWENVFDMVRRHRPAHIYLLGPMVAELERLSQDHDLAEIFSSIKFAVVTGEPLGARMRNRLTQEWGLHLYNVTGAADTGVAWDCRMHDGFHLWDDYVFAECLDPDTGEPVPDGDPGELVCTALANDTWPLIRHRSGDLVRLDRSPCGCGRTHTRFHLIGRLSDKIEVSGRAIMPAQVWRAIEQLDETAAAVFQIVHPGGPDVPELRIRIGYNPRRTVSLPALEAHLTEAIRAEVGVVPRIELHTEADLLAKSRSGIKLPRVVRS
jgi:phenylacetate-CoA ligase